MGKDHGQAEEARAPGHEQASLAAVARELARIRRHLDELEHEMRGAIEHVPAERRESARNLVHYVALRQHDLRDLQIQLARLGLSSLGRSEGWVRESLQQVARRAHEALALRGDADATRALDEDLGGGGAWQAAKDYLHRHTREVLGPRPDDRHIYVMVTAPSAKEGDRAWMVRMLGAGMNVLRVNCAHEGEAEWHRLVTALGEARRETGKECRVLMDLAGPKIRTGPIGGTRHIATWKPPRDELGRATAPAHVILRRAGTVPDDEAGATIVVRSDAFDTLKTGDVLRFRDARGKRRSLDVRAVGDDEISCLGADRAYVAERTRARVVRKGRRVGEVWLEVSGGGGAFVDVRAGDVLVLSGRGVDGRPPRRDEAGRVVRPGRVSCTLPDALELLAVGHRVLFDDGRIEALVSEVRKKRGEYVLSVVRTHKETTKLRAEKGINLPDTHTTVPALTDEDVRALAFVGKHADAVSLSFVKRPEDVRRLHEELDRLGRPGIGVVLKIETRAGFENLPRLLLEGLRRPPLAVMIARGDLAVEVGFERLAELQEEILWLCEASHVPAIWATQVLDTLARTGVPSRAEVTDAAASVAAECVMLNKGPFVEDAVRVLSDILRRMEKHHYKKRSLYRKLRVSTFGAA